MSIRLTSYIIVLVIFFGSAEVIAQSSASKPFVLGTMEHIDSKVLGETRILNIYTPPGYSPDSSSTYPVIYLLDGSADEDYIHIVGLTQFLTMIDTMPPCIVVGVGNVNRRRDFTYAIPDSDVVSSLSSIQADKKYFPVSGGSSKFISFIEKELQPFIEKKYKTSNSKTIIGQSLGGLLATEILIRKPELFDRYLIVSPSLWWDHEGLLSQAKTSQQKRANLALRVFIAVGSEGDMMEHDANRLADILRTSVLAPSSIDFLHMPNENHLTILHNAAYQGLEFLFSK